MIKAQSTVVDEESNMIQHDAKNARNGGGGRVGKDARKMMYATERKKGNKER